MSKEIRSKMNYIIVLFMFCVLGVVLQTILDVYIYIYIYIRLKIKPNSVRIRF